MKINEIIKEKRNEDAKYFAEIVTIHERKMGYI